MRLAAACAAGLAAFVLFTSPAQGIRAQEAGERIELKLRLTPGAKFGLKTTSVQTVFQNLGGRSQNLSQTFGFGYTFLVDEIGEDGIASVTVLYDSVLVKQHSPEGSVEYDSSQAEQGIPPALKAFAALPGQSIRMKIGPTGVVHEVDGMTHLLRRLISQLNLPAGPERQLMEKTLESQLSDEALRRAMENMMAIYPEKPVAIGDSWTRGFAVNQGFPVIIDNVWKLRERKEGRAVIDVSAEIKTDPEAGAVDMGGLPLLYDMTGSQSGFLVVSESTGWIDEGRLTQDLSGSVTLDRANLTWPIQVRSNLTFESFQPAVGR